MLSPVTKAVGGEEEEEDVHGLLLWMVAPVDYEWIYKLIHMRERVCNV